MNACLYGDGADTLRYKNRCSAPFWCRCSAIGRQSLYNAFGDKRKLNLEALERYQQHSISLHLERLAGGASALAGIKAMLLGVIPENDDERASGCVSINSVSEFGATAVRST